MKSFAKMAHLTYLKLKRWTNWSHLRKSWKYISHQYWRLERGRWDYAPHWKALWQLGKDNRHLPLLDQYRMLCLKLRKHYPHYAIRSNYRLWKPFTKRCGGAGGTG